jgi:hypothetical protein
VRASVSSAVPLGAALSLLLPACQPDAPAPDEQSTYVDLYLHDGIEICEGQLDAYDRFVERIFPFYTGEPAAGFRVDVHVLAEPDCGAGQSCIKEPRAESPGPSRLLGLSRPSRASPSDFSFRLLIIHPPSCSRPQRQTPVIRRH